jgi:hypothetical protein
VATLARKVLQLPVLRYVDDHFGPEDPECLEHAMNCFARFVRVLLGPDAIEETKLEYGMSLVVVGAEIKFSMEGYACRPAPKTCRKCLADIEKALKEDSMLPGVAKKLAGRLNWSTQCLFQRVGRAMLRPIYEQKHSRSGSLRPVLRTALRWWRMVLQGEIAEKRSWRRHDEQPAHLYVDARSTPARCAAVLFMDGRVLYTDGKPSDRHAIHERLHVIV